MKKPEFNKDIFIDNKHKAIAIGAGVVLSIALIGGGVHTHNQNKYAEEMQKQIENAKAEQAEYTVGNNVAGFDFDSIPYVKDGYANIDDYWNDVQEMRSSAEGIADSAIRSYGAYMTDEQKAMLRQYENSMTGAATIEDFNGAKEKFDEIVDDCRPVYVYIDSGYSGGSYSGSYANFRRDGVLYDSGYRYTYYSSNVLRHYKTDQWTLGSDGIYRDSNGRVIVASDAHPQGTVLNTELFGEVVVQDCGVGRSDTLDVYTGF